MMYMLNSIVNKLKDKTVVMALLSYVLTICTTLGISVDVNNVNIVAVSICGIMTLLGIMHDSGSSNVTPIQTSDTSNVSKEENTTSEVAETK